MKNFIFALLGLLLVGCAATKPSVNTNVTNPLFFKTKPDSTIFVEFKNTATNENVENEILKEFIAQGYVIAQNIEHADFVVLGNVISFNKNTIKERNPNMVVSTGFGYGRGYYPRHYSTIGMGYIFDDDAYTNSYFYALNATLSVTPRGENEQKTTISIIQRGGRYTHETIWPLFRSTLAKQVVSVFYKVK